MIEKKVSIESDEIIEFYNKMIFQEAYRKGIKVKNLKEEMEIRGTAPTLLTEKVFLRELIDFIEKKYSNKNHTATVTVENSKPFLNKLIKDKTLFKKRNLIATKLYVDFEKSMHGEPFTTVIRHLQKENVDVEEDTGIQCPYCDSQVKLSGKNVQKEYICKKCSKEFLTVTGIVRRREGSFTRTVTFGAPPFVVRIKTDSREMSIAFRTEYRFDANSGDKITFIFTKSTFFKKYNLTSLLNWNTRTNNKIKASEVSIN